MITKDKRADLLLQVKNQVYNKAHINMPYTLQNGGNIVNELKQNIEFTIQQTVIAAFEELINNLYTQEDLEKDLTLTK